MDNSDAHMAPQPGDCISYRLRRTARAAARHYDKALKPADVRNTQFTLLSTLETQGEVTIGDMAKTLGVDATTLTRNMDVMVRRGLIENVGSDDARERRMSLTAAGQSTFAVALPLWQAAQQALLSSLPDINWPETAQALDDIEQICSSPG